MGPHKGGKFRIQKCDRSVESFVRGFKCFSDMTATMLKRSALVIYPVDPVFLQCVE